MNIHVTDPNPYNCSKNLDDARVRKMLLEMAQMLSVTVAYKLFGNNIYTKSKQLKNFINDELQSLGLYKLTHVKHPCNTWLIADNKNFSWGYRYLHALVQEYYFRTGKTHKSSQVFFAIRELIVNYEIPLITFQFPTYFANCPRKSDGVHDFTHITETLGIYEAYKLYLQSRWKSDTIKLTWTGRKVPDFYKEA